MFKTNAVTRLLASVEKHDESNEYSSVFSNLTPIIGNPDEQTDESGTWNYDSWTAELNLKDDHLTFSLIGTNVPVTISAQGTSAAELLRSISQKAKAIKVDTDDSELTNILKQLTML
jgi:hypothetical protein